MKTIGIIILISSFSLIGFIFANDYISVLKGIKRANIFLKDIIFCLRNEHMSIPDIFEYIYATSDCKTKEFIDKLSPQNFQKTEEIAEKCGFCKDKASNLALLDALSVLGKCSANEQIAEIELCRNKIISIYESSEKDLKEKAKFAQKLGILSGIFITILII